MRATLVGFASVVLLFVSTPVGAGSDDSAPPMVDQLLVYATALELSPSQVDALEVIRDRRVRALAALRERLRTMETQSTATAEHDSLTLMQEIGRLQVLSGREALQQLSSAQRRHWVEIQAARKR